ncbi:hypothetical protein GE061_005548 [Apolygus lucorum]|uniref:Bee-milk protein n=1 Tax=Apolygus lucorum TaxID=248454 RepID=A0A8S9WYD1_APOLU|nr:hypothetical protein GE061_005548 [Apolygus lucorum]
MKISKIHRFLGGVPFTLGAIHISGPCKAEPILSPYPAWESHDSGEKGIVNAVDIFIDRKKILWILDVGIIDTLEKPKVVGPPKVVAICLMTSKIVATVDLSQFCTFDSRFHEIQVEVTEEDDTFIYVSDAGCKAIVVWDYSREAGFKVQLPPEVAEDGSCKDILYLTLLNNNYLYFSFMNGRKMFRTSTSNLRCPKSLTEAEDVGTKPGKLVILGSDRKRKMFFRGKGDNQIYLWDSNKPFKACSFVAVDAPPQGMYSTHVVVGSLKYVWALSSNFPDFAGGNRGSIGPFVKLHPVMSLRCPDGNESGTDNSTESCNGTLTGGELDLQTLNPQSCSQRGSTPLSVVTGCVSTRPSSVPASTAFLDDLPDFQNPHQPKYFS